MAYFIPFRYKSQIQNMTLLPCQISDLWWKSKYFFNEFHKKKYAKSGHKSRKLKIYIKEEYCKNANNTLI